MPNASCSGVYGLAFGGDYAELDARNRRPHSKHSYHDVTCAGTERCSGSRVTLVLSQWGQDTVSVGVELRYVTGSPLSLMDHRPEDEGNRTDHDEDVYDHHDALRVAHR